MSNQEISAENLDLVVDGGMDKGKEKDKPLIKKIIDSALYVVKNYVSKEPDTIVSIEKLDGKWVVVVEVVERKVIPNTQDIMGRYEIKLGPKGDLIGWRQLMVRKRSDPIGM
jgi:hypothetical protein